MKVIVRLFAVLRERAGTDRIELADLPDELDMAGLKRTLSERFSELGDLSAVRGVRGTRYVDDDTPLVAGEEVSLLPPVSGGAPDAGEHEQRMLARGQFEIHATVLEPEQARLRVGHASCGATVVFTGTTRERNRERDVVRLDYEAFAAMAGAEMERIFDECNERFGPASRDASGTTPQAEELALRMLVLHRTGTVGVGEPSVVVAVASPHRDAAFAAARFLIDELKARVPLWKKEQYGDGHHWIGERS